MKKLSLYKNKIEFFIADDVDILTFRDEVASMEHPFFALKTGDTKEKEYKNGCVTITIRSLAGLGLATIFDKDIWIYAISKLEEAINNKKEISRKIIFTPYEFFIRTNRDKSGRAYDDLKKTLSRLKGTVINTNIVYSKKEQKTAEFGLLDSWRILEEKKGLLEIGMVEITLPDWLYQAIKKTKVLKINSDYFRIRKAIDRRLYEIARKHCGNQNEFVIKLEKLHLKTGSISNITKFKFNIKRLEKINYLPDYKIFYDNKNDNVIFINRKKEKITTKIIIKKQNQINRVNNIDNITDKMKKAQKLIILLL